MSSSVIWHTHPTTQDMMKRASNSLSDHLGIIFNEVGDDYVKATMPINNHTRQPMGIMHGGASCVLAETLGSTAAQYCVNVDSFYCVGLDINTNHIRAIREGLVIATAKPYHLGRSTQVWSIEIHNEADELISINRLTMAVLAKK